MNIKQTTESTDQEPTDRRDETSPDLPAVQMLAFAEQAQTLLKPMRIELMRLLTEPQTCGELGKTLGATQQKIYYHVKALEAAGLVRQVGERKVRGLRQAIYQATARSYWLSPELAALAGGKQAVRDEMSRGYLLNLAEQLLADARGLALSTQADKPGHTLSLDARIELADESQRGEFLAGLQQAIQDLAVKFGAHGATSSEQGETFRVVLACYPSNESNDDTSTGMQTG